MDDDVDRLEHALHVAEAHPDYIYQQLKVSLDQRTKSNPSDTSLSASPLFLTKLSNPFYSISAAIAARLRETMLNAFNDSEQTDGWELNEPLNDQFIKPRWDVQLECHFVVICCRLHKSKDITKPIPFNVNAM